MRHLQGLLPKETPRGEFDLYVFMATRYRWTPEQVNDLTDDFLQELLAYNAAEARWNEEQEKEARRKADAARARTGR